MRSKHYSIFVPLVLFLATCFVCCQGAQTSANLFTARRTSASSMARTAAVDAAAEPKSLPVSAAASKNAGMSVADKAAKAQLLLSKLAALRASAGLQLSGGSEVQATATAQEASGPTTSTPSSEQQPAEEGAQVSLRNKARASTMSTASATKQQSLSSPSAPAAAAAAQHARHQRVERAQVAVASADVSRSGGGGGGAGPQARLQGGGSETVRVLGALHETIQVLEEADSHAFKHPEVQEALAHAGFLIAKINAKVSAEHKAEQEARYADTEGMRASGGYSSSKHAQSSNALPVPQLILGQEVSAAAASDSEEPVQSDGEQQQQQQLYPMHSHMGMMQAEVDESGMFAAASSQSEGAMEQQPDQQEDASFFGMAEPEPFAAVFTASASTKPAKASAGQKPASFASSNLLGSTAKPRAASHQLSNSATAPSASPKAKQQSLVSGFMSAGPKATKQPMKASLSSMSAAAEEAGGSGEAEGGDIQSMLADLEVLVAAAEAAATAKQA